MRRFKILIVALIAVPLVFMLFMIYGNTSEPKPEPKVVVETPKTLETVADPEDILLYHKKRKKLRTVLTAYFKKAVAAGDIVGAGVSIVKGDSILVSEGFGKRKSGGKDKVDGETIFRLGSLSKGFAGVLAADLEDEGKIQWSDKVRDFIPEFQLGDTKNTNKITLAHILSHTSGTPYHSFTNLVDAGIPLQEIAKQFKDVKPISEPGALYSYQNAMFSLSGEMMRKVTGESIADALQSRFFNPLEMCSTTTDYEVLSNSPDIAVPHVRTRHGWRSTKLTDSYHNAIAAGGINASAGDMAKWMRFLLGHNPEIMDKAALREAFTPFIALNENNKYYQRWPGHLRSYYGFGWRIHKFWEGGNTTEKTMWHHGGSVNHFRNEIAVYPDADLGICVLLNSNSGLARTVIPDLYEIIADIYVEGDVDVATTATSDTSDLISTE
ncbi:MAG: serine hydrolase domain-containing protein [Pricia sp.]